jgi:transporter family-2 protein
MNAFLLYPLVIVAGALQAMGNCMNAQLRNSVVNPWLASIISFGLILAFFIVAFAVNPKPLPSIESIYQMPWWAPVGGLAGAVAVFVGLTMIDKIGAGPLNGLIITANIIASVIIDHYGFLNMPAHPISAWRILGTILMVGGITLIARF